MNVYLNIKMENNSSGKKKKGVSWVVDKFLNLFLIACGVVVIWILLQVTSIATFKIPSDSMEPALLAGDNILVNKWVMGGRIFNIWDALEGKEVKISRLPGLGKIRRNDVLVFNFPYPAQWDSIGLNVMSYYVKRCVALPGDTFEIRKAHYWVRSCETSLGNVDSQDALMRIVANGREKDY